jgi:hypothetical protein
MNRNMVFGQVVIDEGTEAAIQNNCFGQRGSDAKRHPAIAWGLAVFSFRTRPAAKTPSIRRRRISPVSASTPTSAKCAP